MPSISQLELGDVLQGDVGYLCLLQAECKMSVNSRDNAIMEYKNLKHLQTSNYQLNIGLLLVLFRGHPVLLPSFLHMQYPPLPWHLPGSETLDLLPLSGA